MMDLLMVISVVAAFAGAVVFVLFCAGLTHHELFPPKRK
jgi:hypothetical protein